MAAWALRAWIGGVSGLTAPCIRSVILRIMIFLSMSAAGVFAPSNVCTAQEKADSKSTYAEIRVVDAGTGRGMPLVELEMVNHLRFVTDNAGRVAFLEPGLMGREVHFKVKSHGYETPKDGFGLEGVRVVPQVGKPQVIRLKRQNLAERLGRLTGEGLYRDSHLLGYPLPRGESANPGLVAGQDSVQAVPYKNQIYWFWGDTSQMKYPLGLFRTAGAKTAIPGLDDDLTHGFAFDYFVDPKTKFARAMIPMADHPGGVVWIDGVCTVPDEKGIERMVAHYSLRKGLIEEIEHGIALYNDEKEIFERLVTRPVSDQWRIPKGHPMRFEKDGVTWLLFGNPALNVRVPAKLSALIDPQQYEAFTCAQLGNEKKRTIQSDGSGAPQWRWQKEIAPTGSEEEMKWMRSGALKSAHARFSPLNAKDATERVTLHNGSVHWNAHRKRWIMIACQAGGKTSFLGEIWYAEAESPFGPYTHAVKVITHDHQSFYNVCHHPFLDREGGRFIHFEGTYTADFSNDHHRTPRYNYNQILYRLDLDAPELQPLRK